MTRHQTTAPMPCPVCDSRRYDDDLAFAGGYRWWRDLVTLWRTARQNITGR